MNQENDDVDGIDTEQSGQNDTALIEDEKTIVLTKPVVLGNDTYDRLELREPLIQEIEKASQAGQGITVAIALVSIVAKVPMAVVRKMAKRDFMAASNYLSLF